MEESCGLDSVTLSVLWILLSSLGLLWVSCLNCGCCFQKIHFSETSVAACSEISFRGFATLDERFQNSPAGKTTLISSSLLRNLV